MITANDISNRSFRMTRGDGSVVARAVYMLPDGRVVGTRQPTEAFWTITGDSLEFLDLGHNVTTRFGKITRDAAGWRLEGPFLPDAGSNVVHILDESPYPVDRRDFGRSPANTSVAVMVRTHLIDDRVRELIEHLENGRKDFDLYLIFDETNGRPEIDLPNIVWHSTKQCPGLGLTQTRDRLLWWCGDFPFYFALNQLPQYQYYAMVEYDVYLTQRNASLFNDLASALNATEAGRVDAVGTRLRREDPRDDKLHVPAFNFFDTTYSYFFPLIVLSRPAVSYLYSQRLIEATRGTPSDALIHCESFVPSHLIRAGFTCVDLNAVLPGSYRNDLMILPGRYHGMANSLADGFAGYVRMIHPVYSDTAFLQRLLDNCRNDAERQGFLRHLDSGEFEPIPEAVRSRFRVQPGGSEPDAKPGMQDETRSSREKATMAQHELAPAQLRPPGIISELLSELYGGDGPLAYADERYVDKGYPHTNLQGGLVRSVIDVAQPQFWLELGSMLGGSAIQAANIIKHQSAPTEIVCIDPFTGDVNMWAWEQPKKRANEWQFLRLERGRPTIYDRFLANVAAAGHSDIILPIAATSIVGIKLLRRLADEKRITSFPTVIYLDSAHEADETFLELQHCWSLLKPGGVLMGDDWVWAAVRNDILRFVQTIQLDRDRSKPLIERHQRFTEQDGVLLDGNQWVIVK